MLIATSSCTTMSYKPISRCNKGRVSKATKEDANLSQFLHEIIYNICTTNQKTDEKFKFSIPDLPRKDKNMYSNWSLTDNDSNISV